MPLSFPQNPQVNQTYTAGGATWTWTGIAWKRAGTMAGLQGVQGIAGSGTQGIQGTQGLMGLSQWTRKTANYTSQDRDRLIADTSGGTFTITLPANPALGAYVVITDGYDFEAINLLVARNNSTIEGVADDVLLDILGTTFEFIYDGTTWQITSTAGRQGLQGTTGAGSQGVQGIQGSLGVQGTAGFIGSNGSQGTQGIAGATATAAVNSYVWFTV
jgi:hypothetical protein